MGKKNNGFLWLRIRTIGIRFPQDPVQATSHIQTQKLHDEWSCISPPTMPLIYNPNSRVPFPQICLSITVNNNKHKVCLNIVWSDNLDSNMKGSSSSNNSSSVQQSRWTKQKAISGFKCTRVTLKLLATRHNVLREEALSELLTFGGETLRKGLQFTGRDISTHWEKLQIGMDI